VVSKLVSENGADGRHGGGGLVRRQAQAAVVRAVSLFFIYIKAVCLLNRNRNE
jgi:hypothetical protein